MGMQLELEWDSKPVAALSQGGGFQPVLRQPDFGRRRGCLDCAPCQIVVIVTRFPRTR